MASSKDYSERGRLERLADYFGCGLSLGDRFTSLFQFPAFESGAAQDLRGSPHSMEQGDSRSFLARGRPLVEQDLPQASLVFLSLLDVDRWPRARGKDAAELRLLEPEHVSSS